MTMSVERNMSVDDLVGGLWRHMGQAAGGFHRTDSEAAFQEFLKRIPSASNVTASAGQFDSASAAQFQHQLHQQNSASTSGHVGAETSTGATPGIPRVPSLDFLRQLATVQQQITAAPALKLEPGSGTPPPGPLPLPALTAADLASLNASALAQLRGIPLPPPLAPPLQHQLPGNARHGGAVSAHSSDPSSDRGGTERTGGRKAISRANRMLSNRESARRSRRRKQEHLDQLEAELAVLNEEKKNWADRMQTSERRCTSIEEENVRLRQENERLRDELLFLRSELSTDRNNYARRNGRQHRTEEDELHATKRPRCEGEPEQDVQQEAGKFDAAQQ